MKLHALKENSNTHEFLEILKKKHAPYLANERVTDDQLICIFFFKTLAILFFFSLALLEKLKTGPPKKPLKEIPKPQPQAQTSKLGKLEPLGSINNKPSSLSKPSPNDFWTKTSNTNGTKAMASDDLYAEDFDDDFGGEKDEDLNKLDTEALKQKKAKMDILFSKNQKKPGDKDFQYDVQEDFNPKFANEWDLDDDEDIV